MDTSAHDVAAYIVGWFRRRPTQENDLTHLKLQKLLYYCQGYYLGWKGVPLFPEHVEAWEHGPVVRSVYKAYADALGQGTKVITTPETGDTSTLAQEARALITEVLNVCGQYSAWRLRQLTHSEPPWADHYEEGHKRRIPQDSMREFFKGRVSDS